MLMREQMHDYQRKAVAKILNTPKCALWLDMGLGKTVSTLTALSDMIESFEIGRVLIIAPLRVCNTVWMQEAQKWEHLQGLTFAIATGSQQQRQDAIASGADIVLINRENIKWLHDTLKSKWPFDCVVLDESSSFKSSSSQRWKALRKRLPQIRRMVQLTGTPSPNGLLDVWAQAYLLDSGERLGRTMTAYKQRYFDSDYMGFKFTAKDTAQAEIERKLSDIIISMTADDYLQMPERINSVVNVEMPTDSVNAYKALCDDMLIEISDSVITAPSAATLANKLLQAANGAIYDAEGAVINLHDAKLDALRDIVESVDEPLLVAYNFKHDLAKLQSAFPDAVVLDKSDTTVKRWNDGKIKILLAHPASAGHGLNLQHGGSLCIWYGLTWSLECYQQFNARLYRQGQTKPVRIIHLVSQGTIDNQVLDVLDSKQTIQQALIDALRY